jgi:hypothetical protein
MTTLEIEDDRNITRGRLKQKWAKLTEPTEEASHSPKSKKRNNDLSQSCDTHEDGGPCQMKTTHDTQALFHICGDL